jgi:hypothetical protein
MKILMDSDKFVHTVVTCLYLLIVLLMWSFWDPVKHDDLVRGIKILTYLCLGVYIWIAFSAYRIHKQANVYLILILLSIPFYLGDQLSILLHYQDKMMTSDHSILDGIIPNEHIYSAMFLLMACLLTFHIGYITIYDRKRNNDDSIRAREGISRSVMRMIGMAIYLITIIPTLIARMYEMYIAISIGHLSFRLSSGQYFTGIFYFADYLSDWFVPSCFMILIANQNRLDKIISTMSILAYCVIYVLSGNRFEVMGIVFALACTYIYWFEVKVPLSKIFKYSFLAFLGIIAFEVVGAARNISSGVSMFSKEILDSVFDRGILYSIFETTGNTFTSIANTIRCVPAMVPYNYGKSIIGSLIYIFPSGIRNALLGDTVLHISATLSPYYYGWTLSGYGSSYITEAYFNFGYFAIPIVMIYGGVLAVVSQNFIDKSKDNAYAFFFYIYLINEFAMAIRNDLYQTLRHVVLYVFLPYFVCRIVSIKTKNMRN